MADMPDLSHLTPEERAIIEGVMMRQRQEEQREHEVMRRKQDEVAVLEQTIRTRNEMQRAAGVELAATCHICLKTKFADGVGHSCHYCSVRCCARCGGKVTLRSNKVIWVCILCRKKQELLSKTGQWIHKGAGQDSMLWQMENDLRGLVTPSDSSMDKRPKLERAHSAAEKENQPLLRASGGGALRRQLSQQETRCYGELDGLARSHPHLLQPRHKAGYAPEEPRRSPHPAHLPPRSSSSDEDAPECVSDENDEFRDRGQLGRQPRAATLAAPEFYDVTNDGSTYEVERAECEPSSGGRSFDSATEPHWRARDLGDGAYLRPYATDERPGSDRNVYKSAHLWEDSSDSRQFTERRKKTVRFDGHDGAATFPRGGRDGCGPLDWTSLRWESSRQTSQDSATKDSGIDTSSTFTSSEDSNRGDCPKFPLSWQVSADGSRMVGHMVLRKTVVEGKSHSSAAILGLKVVGGKLTSDGGRVAVVEKVKKGSIADIEGQLRIGDEVLQWNGVHLQGRSADEVARVVADSKQDSHVELVVSRPIAPRHPPQPWRTHKDMYTEVIGSSGCDKPSVMVTSPGSPDVHTRHRRRHTHHSSDITGRIQLKLYFDINAFQLLVSVISASSLTLRVDGQPRCPYAKIFLLPDKSEKSKRRTKTLANTQEPRWNQTFVYCGLKISDIRKRTLEVTVWDLNRYGPNDFLGEVLLELDNVEAYYEPNWYSLKPHDENRVIARYADNDVDGEHLSPPSTSTSRFSDSDTTSENDLRRHHSMSSLASSTSPPPSHERMEIEGTRRSRRDMSPAGRVRAAGMARERGSSNGGCPRSQSAAAGARPQRSRSKSPRRSLSPPADSWRYTVSEDRGMGGSEGSRLPTHAYTPRFQSRSATATPTTSPKKRQLPQIPHQSNQRTVRAQVSADLEERKWIAPHHIGATLAYRSTPQGWERHYTGLSDSELAARGGGGWAPPRRRLSPDAAAADSDIESVGSVTSSAFSTQSERPRPTRMLSRKKRQLPSTSSSCDSSAPIPINHNCSCIPLPKLNPSKMSYHRQLPCVIVPVGSEGAIQRRLKTIVDSVAAQTNRTRSRKCRKNIYRSRSASTYAKDNTRISKTYARSHSCPDYPPTPQQTNIYKITENNRDYIFHVDFSQLVKQQQRIRDQDTKTENRKKLPTPYQYQNEPFININVVRKQATDSQTKLHQQYSSNNSKNECRRLLPQISYAYSYENTDTTHSENYTIRNEIISIDSNQDYSEITKSKESTVQYVSNDECVKQYHVDEKDQEINTEYVNRLSKQDSDVQITDTESKIACNIAGNNDRKKLLSLNLKFSYDKNLNEELVSKDIKYKELIDENVSPKIDESKSYIALEYKDSLRRRHSDSVFLKCSTFRKSLNSEFVNKFIEKEQVPFSKINVKMPKSNKSSFEQHIATKKQGNVVSIKDTPSFLEFEPLLPPSVDLSLKEPLPSIIKKARCRSFSVASASRLEREVGNIANSVITALSPVGSSRAAHDSVAATHPLSSTPDHVLPDDAGAGSRRPSALTDLKTIQSLANQKNRHNFQRKPSQKTGGKKTRDKTSSRTKRHSNEYGGRENGRSGNQSQPLDRRESRRGQFTRSLSNADVPPDDKADGSLSDTAIGGEGDLEPAADDSLLKAEPRDFFGPGMGKKSNSTSQLSATGRKRRLGFGKRGKNSFTVQRSEEVVPGEMRGAGVAGGVSRASSGSSDNGDGRWSPGMRGSGSAEGGGGGLLEFIDGLGPGQLYGRQLLGACRLGDVQLSMLYQKDYLEVEVIRARGLQARIGSRSLPTPYVKVYLVNGKRCLAKAKTSTARRTLNPLYQQTLKFRENCKGCVLQVTVWGDYGRIEGKKVFMGIAQIVLDEINLSQLVIGWYKLFGTTSL